MKFLLSSILILCISNFIVSLTTIKVPKKLSRQRKLGLLDWFDSEEEKHETTDTANFSKSIQKTKELVELANEFQTDPDYKIGLDISYRNNESGALSGSISKTKNSFLKKK